MKFRVAMPHSAHASAPASRDGCTYVHMYVWKQGTFISSFSPLPPAMHRRRRPFYTKIARTSSLSLPFFAFSCRFSPPSSLLSLSFFPQVEPCTIVRLKTRGLFSRYVAFRDQKKMTVVACTVALSCHRSLCSWVIFWDSRNFPRLDLSPEKIALYRGRRDGGVPPLPLFSHAHRKYSSRETRCGGGVIWNHKTCYHRPLRNIYKHLFIFFAVARLLTDKNISDPLLFQIVFFFFVYFMQFSCSKFLCVM